MHRHHLLRPVRLESRAREQRALPLLYPLAIAHAPLHLFPPLPTLCRRELSMSDLCVYLNVPPPASSAASLVSKKTVVTSADAAAAATRPPKAQGPRAGPQRALAAAREQGLAGARSPSAAAATAAANSGTAGAAAAASSAADRHAVVPAATPQNLGRPFDRSWQHGAVDVDAPWRPIIDGAYCAALFQDMVNPRWSFILPPASAKFRLALNKGAPARLQTLSGRPCSVALKGSIGELAFALQQTQFQGMMVLLAQLSHNPKALQMLEQKQEASIEELRKDSARDSEAVAERIRLGIQYAQLYKRNFLGYEELTAAERETLLQLESKETFQTVVQWREAAVAVVQTAYVLTERPTWRVKRASGIMSRFFARGPAKPKVVATDDVVQELVANPSALDQLQEARVKQALDLTYVGTEVDLSLEAASFRMLGPDRELLVSLGLHKLKATLQMRVSSMSVTVTVADLVAVDALTQGTIYPTFVARTALLKGSVIDGTALPGTVAGGGVAALAAAAASAAAAGTPIEPLFTLALTTNDKAVRPADGLDMRLSVDVAPLTIVANVALLLNVGAFFVMPAEALFMGELTQRAQQRFEALRETVQEAAIQALEVRVSLSLWFVVLS